MILVMKGKAWKYGDNICGDSIMGSSSRDLSSIEDPSEIANVCMVGIDPEFQKKAKKGDFIVAGRNFGCVRIHNPVMSSFKAFGVAGILAESFSRLFFRLAIKRGMPFLEVKDITKKVMDGEDIEVNFKTGEIKTSKGKVIKAQPLPDILFERIEASGSLHYIKKLGLQS